MKTYIVILSILAAIILVPYISTAQGEDSCQRNATCYPRWKNEMHSVVTIGNYMAIGFGSGVLLNNVKSDKTPYVLTAYHVLANAQWDESNLYFYFRYEKQCGGYDSSFQEPLIGATIVDTNAYHDIALLKLNNPIPESYPVYYSGWDAKKTQTDSVVCIHHPVGQPARLAIRNAQVSTSSLYQWGFSGIYLNGIYWTAAWDTGYLAAGSSGSPLFDMSGRALGVEIAGNSQCNVGGYTTGWDALLSFQGQWSIFKPYLDPQNTGTLVLDGLDPDSVRSITFDQKLANGTSADSLGRWMPDSAFRPFPVPDTLFVKLSANETFKATLNIDSNQKYNNWFGKTDVTNIDTLKSSMSAIHSQLQLTYSGIIVKNQLVDVPTLNSGIVGFRDPWLIDSADNNHAGAPTNRGQTNAIWHDAASGFNPNMTTSGTHLKYKGVFLNEGDIHNLQPPYYSVRVQQTQTLGGYSNCSFLGWTATASTSAQFQNADSAQTPVVFQSSTTS